MSSVIVSWTGSCPEHSVREALFQQLERIARLSHSYFDEPREIAHFDGRVTGTVVATEAVTAGGELAVPVADADDPGPRPHVELRAAGPLQPSITIGGPLQSIPFVDLHGMAFRLYDGREMYPNEDVLSFVFATLPGDDAPGSHMVEVLADDLRERTNRAAIRRADCALLRPSIHLRYYLEEWVDLLLGTIKYFYVPDLVWWAYQECPRYREVAAILEGEEDDGTLADRAFDAIADGLRREVESWAEDAATVKSFWDSVRNQPDG